MSNEAKEEVVGIGWDVFEIPFVEEVIGQAVRRVSRKYVGVVEAEDLEQECRIWMVKRISLQEVAIAGEPGLLQHGLEQDLGDFLLPRAREKGRTVLYDPTAEVGD